MTNVEIAEILNSVDMYELACKTNAGLEMSETENMAIAELDRRFKEIGELGHDKDHEIAQFIRKTINEEIYNVPDEILDMIFERGEIGEFDDYESIMATPKNTLVAHEAAKGGNVNRSFLDTSVLAPTWKNRQIETDISFADVKRQGWKSIALLTEYATAAFKNYMFYDVLSAIDAAIAQGAENCIVESTTMPTQASMDKMALHLMDYSDGGEKTIIGLSKYIQAASKLNGFSSDEMKNEVHRNGRLGVYDSCALHPITAAKKVTIGAKEAPLVPDYRLFGIAGKIGNLDMKGSVNVYQTEDTNKEKFHLKFADFTYGYSFNNDTLEKVCKMEIASA